MRGKKSLKNLVFNILQQVIGVLAGFVLPPLIIESYGSSVNGLISTIKEYVKYAQITGYGISSASTYALYKPLANNDHKTISGIFNSCKKFFIKSGNIMSGIMAIIAVLYPVFVANQINGITVFLLIIIIGACGLSEFYFIGKYQALLSADQKNYIVAIAQGLGNIFNIVISYVLIKANCSIILVQIGATVVYLTRVLLLTIYVKKNYSYLDNYKECMDDKISQRKDAIIHEVTALVINSSSVVLISIMLGLEEASIYSVYLLVFSGLNVICSIISNAIYASFGDVIAKKQTDVLKNSFDIFEWGYLIAVFIIYSITYILLIPFITLYTRNIVDVNYILPKFGALFVLLGVINNIKIPARTLVIAAGHYKETKKYSIIELLINIISQVVLILIFGIYGALLGCLLSALYRAINFITYTNKNIVKISNKKVIKRLAIYSILSLAILFVYDSFIDLSISSYSQWILLAIVLTIIISLIYIIASLIFDRNTTKKFVHFIKYSFGKN